MKGKTGIEWTDETNNPVIVCERVSAGCDNCYAFALHDMRHAIYLKNNGLWRPDGPAMPKQYAKPFTEVQFFPERLERVLKDKTPKKIFLNSMSDLFHKSIPDEYILWCFDIMRQAHWHTFQVLTKRVGRLRRLTPLIPWSANICIGVSIENDPLTARANVLRPIPFATHMLSCEPLLGPLPSLDLTGIDWVITGGESGPNARPCEVEWVRDLRDRCVEAGVAFFFKQWGGRTPKVGGRELDGRQWNHFPVLSQSRARDAMQYDSHTHSIIRVE
ncbi:MAG: phage Gp37/Gp68 family protein [Ktedonobacteraceae bacterium]|nr:phage Gp37/Gp68 family protein [Ktedonobacteraceae bacterium]